MSAQQRSTNSTIPDPGGDDQIFPQNNQSPNEVNKSLAKRLESLRNGGFTPNNGTLPQINALPEPGFPQVENGNPTDFQTHQGLPSLPQTPPSNLAKIPFNQLPSTSSQKSNGQSNQNGISFKFQQPPLGNIHTDPNITPDETDNNFFDRFAGFDLSSLHGKQGLPFSLGSLQTSNNSSLQGKSNLRGETKLPQSDSLGLFNPNTPIKDGTQQIGNSLNLKGKNPKPPSTLFSNPTGHQLSSFNPFGIPPDTNSADGVKQPDQPLIHPSEEITPSKELLNHEPSFSEVQLNSQALNLESPPEIKQNQGLRAETNEIPPEGAKTQGKKLDNYKSNKVGTTVPEINSLSDAIEQIFNNPGLRFLFPFSNLKTSVKVPQESLKKILSLHQK